MFRVFFLRMPKGYCSRLLAVYELPDYQRNLVVVFLGEIK